MQLPLSSLTWLTHLLNAHISSCHSPLYFVSPRERPWRQRVILRKTLVIVCVFSRIQKGTPGLMHKGCVLQRVSLGALSDVTLSDVMVVLGMRQSIVQLFCIHVNKTTFILVYKSNKWADLLQDSGWITLDIHSSQPGYKTQRIIYQMSWSVYKKQQ